MIRRAAVLLRSHPLVIASGAAAAWLMASGRVTLAEARRATDVTLLLVLFALLIAVEILRESGWLDAAVAALVTRFHETRSFALTMIAMAGILAAVVTNDVALFVVIPFTVAAHRLSNFDLEDLVILEIIASNLIGSLTPLGNPQNLFVFHRAQWTAGHFVVTMLPFVGLCCAALAAAVFLLGPSMPLDARVESLPPRNAAAAVAGLITLALVAMEIAHIVAAWPAATAAAIAAVFYLRRPVDLSVIALFLFAFVIIEGLPELEFETQSTYWNAIGVSQLISNVPATILLTKFAAGRWRELLYGANAGGCGTIISSLANFLGWRIYVRESGRDPRFFWRLTAISFAFLAWTSLSGWFLLQVN